MKTIKLNDIQFNDIKEFMMKMIAPLMMFI